MRVLTNTIHWEKYADVYYYDSTWLEASKQKRDSFFECEKQENEVRPVRVFALKPLPIEEVRRTCFLRCVRPLIGQETERHVRTWERYLNFELWGLINFRTRSESRS